MSALRRRDRVYLDTSTFDFIAERREWSETRAFFDNRRLVVVASEHNLQEALRTPDSKIELRVGLVRAITHVATNVDSDALFGEIGLELRSEMARYRPDWIHRKYSEDRAELIKVFAKELWEALRADPSHTPRHNEFLKEATYEELGSLAAAQREKRSILQSLGRGPFPALGQGNRIKDFQIIGGPMLRDPTWEFGHPAEAECRAAWYHDYRRILVDERLDQDLYFNAEPYLRWDTIKKSGLEDPVGFAEFWMRLMKLRRMPIHTWMFFVHMAQLEHRIRSSNLFDVFHSLGMLKASIWVTSDKELYESVEGARRTWMDLSGVLGVDEGALGRHIFVDRNSESSVVEQLQQLID